MENHYEDKCSKLEIDYKQKYYEFKNKYLEILKKNVELEKELKKYKNQNNNNNNVSFNSNIIIILFMIKQMMKVIGYAIYVITNTKQKLKKDIIAMIVILMFV